MLGLELGKPQNCCFFIGRKRGRALVLVMRGDEDERKQLGDASETSGKASTLRACGISAQQSHQNLAHEMKSDGHGLITGPT
jgi:hypothetical protein